jgi:hypothetical protein
MKKSTVTLRLQDNIKINIKYIKMAVLWVVAPCSLLEVYQLFRGPCCLHYRPDDGGSKDL